MQYLSVESLINKINGSFLCIVNGKRIAYVDAKEAEGKFNSYDIVQSVLI